MGADSAPSPSQRTNGAAACTSQRKKDLNKKLCNLAYVRITTAVAETEFFMCRGTLHTTHWLTILNWFVGKSLIAMTCVLLSIKLCVFQFFVSIFLSPSYCTMSY